LTNYYPSELSPSAGFIRAFNEWALLDRGYKIRLSLFLIYNMDKLLLGRKIDLNKPDLRQSLTKCLFSFKNKENKKDALVGILKLL
jgi:hypothetical protein